MPPVKIPVASVGRVMHPYSPGGNENANLIVGNEVEKHLFAIEEGLANSADRITNVKVSMTDHQLLSTIFYSTNNYTEVTQDFPHKPAATKGVHVSYYCTNGAYGVVPVNMTIEFENCPDIFI